MFSQDPEGMDNLNFLVLYEDSSRVPQSGLSCLLARHLGNLFSLGGDLRASQQAAAPP